MKVTSLTEQQARDLAKRLRATDQFRWWGVRVHYTSEEDVMRTVEYLEAQGIFTPEQAQKANEDMFVGWAVLARKYPEGLPDGYEWQPDEPAATVFTSWPEGLPSPTE